MQPSRKIPWGAVALALALGAAATVWLWVEHSNEVRLHEKVLVVRGEGLMTALEAGIRSHRRMGTWFDANIEGLLAETASLPGILGLAVFREDGSSVAIVGEATHHIVPVTSPKWLARDLLVGRAFSIPEMDDEPGLGRGQRGWRWREYRPEETASAQTNTRPAEAPNDSEQTSGVRSFQLAALLDGVEIQRAIRLDNRRFLLSVATVWLAILLGLAAFALNRRKVHLDGELGLARERAQRLEELNRLAAGLAHETKNPLHLIRGMAQSCLNRSGNSDGLHDTARRIVDESDRIVGRINGFLAYSRPKSAELGPVDMQSLVTQIAALFRDEAESKGVRLEVRTQPLSILADSDMVRQILVNLLTNSLAATQPGESITLSLSPSSRFSATLEVSDTGSGIAAEDLPRLTEPYFSRRAGGTGLGLSIVGQLVAAQGWRIAFDSKPGEGTRVSLEGLQIVEAA